MNARRYPYLALFLALAGLGVALWWRHGAPPGHVAHADYVPVATDQPVTPIPTSLFLDARLVSLGDRLFHDKRLSRDNTVACAGCHGLDSQGQDRRPTAIGIGGRIGTVNSPTVFNAGFNFRQFWDGRAATLEEQAAGPVHNVIEMDSNWGQVLAKLRQDGSLVDEFERIWPDGLTAKNIQSAIAEFERSLITPDALFDRFLRGDEQAVSVAVKEGWRLFRDLGCSACHQGVNLGGNLYANLGVMGDYFSERGRPIQKSDLGLYNTTGKEKDKHVFKVPGLRNVGKTGPYFHDGSIASLDVAVRVMARYQLGRSLENDEVDYLLVFLNSLDGQYQGRPL